jgi:signal peptidase II
MKLDRLFTAGLLLSLGLDRWTKELVDGSFRLYESRPLFPGLALTYVRNPGAAFSMLADADPAWRLPFFLIVPLLATAGCVYLLRQTPSADRLSRLALGLVAAGALGNAVDRVLYGEVIDFVEVNLGFWPLNPWPIFNVADSSVFIGVALMFWRSYKPVPQA